MKPGRGGAAAVLALAAVAASAACLDPGEPTAADARVAWVAYPETVRTGETFSFEFAGPISHGSCGRLDTARVAVTDAAIEVEARRSLYLEAMCSDDRRSFYQVRALRIDRPGRYEIRSGGRSLGALVASDSGRFSAMTARGLGTLRSGGGCVLLGPGWASNQRPLALRDPPERVRRLADTDTLVHVEGRLIGFSLCGGFGSRPAVRVDSARATGRTAADWYPEGVTGAGQGGTEPRSDQDREQGGER